MLRADRPPARQRGPRSLIPAAARGPGLALALASVGVAAVTGFALLLAEDRGISGGALVWPAFGAGLVLARLCFGKLPDTLGARRCATVVVPVQGVGHPLPAPPRRTCPSRWRAPRSRAAARRSSSRRWRCSSSAARRTTSAARPSAAFTACFDLGFAVGGVTLGVVADAAGYGAAFTVAAAACAVGALVARHAARGPAWGAPGRPRRRPGGRRHSPRDASNGSRPGPAFTRPARVQRGMCEPSVTVT